MGEVGERSQNNLDCSVHMMPRTRSRAAWSEHCHPWHISYPLLASAYPEKPGQSRAGLLRCAQVFFISIRISKCSSCANNYPPVRGWSLPFPWAELPAQGRDAQGQGDREGTPLPPPHSLSPLQSHPTACPTMAWWEKR